MPGAGIRSEPRSFPVAARLESLAIGAERRRAEASKACLIGRTCHSPLDMRTRGLTVGIPETPTRIGAPARAPVECGN